MPRAQWDEVKKEVGDFIKDEILRSVIDGESPVEQEKRNFDSLNKDYAKDKKGGNTTANLELSGKLLDALDFKSVSGGIEIGIFKSSELGKADGHNNFSGDSKLPQRRFIPESGQDFLTDIMDGVDNIVKEFETIDNDTQDNDLFKSLLADSNEQSSQSTTGERIEVSDLFGDNFFDQFFKTN